MRLLLSILSIVSVHPKVLIASEVPKYEPLCKLAIQRHTAALDAYLNLPFVDFIRAKQYKSRRKAYVSALRQRPEFNDINWYIEDCEKIARQLWKLQLDHSDRFYHKQLSSRLKYVMQMKGLSDKKIEKIQLLTSKWIRERVREKAKEKLQNRELSQEAERSLATKRYNIERLRREEKKRGRSKPLLEYISIDRPEEATPAVLLEEALKHKHMYRCARSYIRHLHNMWRTLRFREQDVILPSRDPRNYKCEAWDLIGSRPSCGTPGASGSKTLESLGYLCQSDTTQDHRQPYSSEPRYSEENLSLTTLQSDHAHFDINLQSDFDAFVNLDLSHSSLDDSSQIASELLTFSDQEEPFLSNAGDNEHLPDANDGVFPDWDDLAQQSN